MTKFFKFGRWWFTTRKEAEKERKHNECIYFDSCQKAYYMRKPKKSIWSF